MTSRRSPRRLSRQLSTWLGGALVILLAVLVLVASVDLAAWVLLGRSWAEVEEVQGLLMVWFALLGAAYALAEGLHLAVELVVERLPVAGRRWASRFSSAAVAGFGALVAVFAVRLAAVVSNTLPATGWSASHQYVPAVLAGVLLAAIGVEQMIWPPAKGSRDGHGPGRHGGPDEADGAGG